MSIFGKLTLAAVLAASAIAASPASAVTVKVDQIQGQLNYYNNPGGFLGGSASITYSVDGASYTAPLTILLQQGAFDDASKTAMTFPAKYFSVSSLYDGSFGGLSTADDDLPLLTGLVPGSSQQTLSWGALTWSSAAIKNPDFMAAFAEALSNLSIDLTPTTGTLASNYAGDSVITRFNIVGLTQPASAPGAVPEPASWAMMIAGFGLVGATMRRRKATVRFA